ncbi:uncharacterized protein LOC143043817 [Mytilus galloprovincialis]|uniref:uncharacterized protein LOC143043817 n=1 Tax=Mytilus galloprovincialis TaxID=29158 RepID=UPI003F7BA20E
MITSGSFGEGLIMRGSDVDVMRVLKQIDISEDTNMSVCVHNIHLTMEMEDTQPGFTKLRLLHTSDQSILEFCYDIGNDFYFSNLSFKRKFIIDMFPRLHGPCITDKDELYDIAYCVHSKLWISPAKKWITRSNTVWPSYDVKQAIVKQGVLFVPLGVKGSTQEEFEWRISFSVGEKLLIYSFTHTQLLCYALLKILLKDVIALDIDCKELLCSYLMKTILFWIFEELPLSIWKPENLISCYMRCFRRLIYCVEYACCPHYFIPDNNLFGNKIHGKAQKLILNRLYILNSYGWQCILLLDQISKLYAMPSDSSMETSYSYAKSVQRLLNSDMLMLETVTNPFKFLIERVIYKVLLGKSSTIKYIYAYYLSIICDQSDLYVPLGDISCYREAARQSFIQSIELFPNEKHNSAF